MPAIHPVPPGRVLFVHGSSMASQPTFDLQVPGRPDSSVMDFFAARGYDTWCVDMEGYGRSTKTRDNNAPISYGADDCFAAAAYIENLRGKRPLLVYGISSGALRAALFAQRHPEMVSRLALDAMVWTGEGSPTLAERSKRLPEFRARNRRPIDRKFVRSISSATTPGPPTMPSSRPSPTPSSRSTIRCRPAPTSTCARTFRSAIPSRSSAHADHARRVRRHRELPGSVKFFEKLPNPDKQFAVMPGIAHASFHQKNYAICQHILACFFSQPAPIYKGGH